MERGIALDVRMTPGTPAPDQQVGVASIIFMAVLIGVVAALVATGLERFVSHAKGAWMIVSAVLLLLSLLGPLGAAATTPARIALVCMHLAAARC
jgi:apolipoprotein N-acyltransferase